MINFLNVIPDCELRPLIIFVLILLPPHFIFVPNYSDFLPILPSLSFFTHSFSIPVGPIWHRRRVQQICWGVGSERSLSPWRCGSARDYHANRTILSRIFKRLRNASSFSQIRCDFIYFYSTFVSQHVRVVSPTYIDYSIIWDNLTSRTCIDHSSLHLFLPIFIYFLIVFFLVCISCIFLDLSILSYLFSHFLHDIALRYIVPLFFYLIPRNTFFFSFRIFSFIWLFQSFYLHCIVFVQYPRHHVGVSMSLLSQFKVTFESIRDLLLQGGIGAQDSTEVSYFIYYVHCCALRYY